MFLNNSNFLPSTISLCFSARCFKMVLFFFLSFNALRTIFFVFSTTFDNLLSASSTSRRCSSSTIFVIRVLSFFFYQYLNFIESHIFYETSCLSVSPSLPIQFTGLSLITHLSCSLCSCLRSSLRFLSSIK